MEARKVAEEVFQAAGAGLLTVFAVYLSFLLLFPLSVANWILKSIGLEFLDNLLSWEHMDSVAVLLTLVLIPAVLIRNATRRRMRVFAFMYPICLMLSMGYCLDIGGGWCVGEVMIFGLILVGVSTSLRKS